jgi:alkanesulfonate monooxygenase SsuD/methylene tetrahydromethanopterin reductase-like flavin-dependent oxidoreductase (luciferase family)
LHYLTASLCRSGFHPGAARLCTGPAWPIGRRLLDMAQSTERIGLRAAWLGEQGAGPFRLDPVVTLGSLIGVTQRLGLGAHWAVDHAEPFHIARVLARLGNGETSTLRPASSWSSGRRRRRMQVCG